MFVLMRGGCAEPSNPVMQHVGHRCHGTAVDTSGGRDYRSIHAASGGYIYIRFRSWVGGERWNCDYLVFVSFSGAWSGIYIQLVAGLAADARSKTLLRQGNESYETQTDRQWLCLVVLRSETAVLWRDWSLTGPGLGLGLKRNRERLI